MLRQTSDGKLWEVSYFRKLQVNEYFRCNGNLWRKRSTRTAVMVKPEEYAGTWFYFEGRQVVERQWSPVVA